MSKYNKYWFDNNWIHKDTGTKVDPYGFDKDWINIDTWTRYSIYHFDIDHINEFTQKPYDDENYDWQWYNPEWVDRNWVRKTDEINSIKRQIDDLNNEKSNKKIQIRIEKEKIATILMNYKNDKKSEIESLLNILNNLKKENWKYDNYNTLIDEQINELKKDKEGIKKENDMFPFKRKKNKLKIENIDKKIDFLEEEKMKNSTLMKDTYDDKISIYESKISSLRDGISSDNKVINSFQDDKSYLVERKEYSQLTHVVTNLEMEISEIENNIESLGKELQKLSY